MGFEQSRGRSGRSGGTPLAGVLGRGALLAWLWIVAAAVAGCGDEGSDADAPAPIFDGSSVAYADGMSLRPTIEPSDDEDPVLVDCSTREPFSGGDSIATTFDVCYRTPGAATGFGAIEGENGLWLATPVGAVPPGAEVVAIRYLQGGRVGRGNPALPHRFRLFSAPTGEPGPPPESFTPLHEQAVSLEGVDPDARNCTEEPLDTPVTVPEGETLWVMIEMRNVNERSNVMVSCYVPDGFRAATYQSLRDDSPYEWVNLDFFDSVATTWIEVEYREP